MQDAFKLKGWLSWLRRLGRFFRLTWFARLSRLARLSILCSRVVNHLPFIRLVVLKLPSENAPISLERYPIFDETFSVQSPLIKLGNTLS